MTIHPHRYRGEIDYWRVRAFLQRTTAAQPHLGGNWQVGDFDYWRWHWMANVVERSLEELLLWEDGDQLAAVLIQGDPGVCHIQIDPEVRSPSLLHSLVEAGERNYVTVGRDGHKVLFVWAGADDVVLQQVLMKRGFQRYESPHAVEVTGWQHLDRHLPEAKPPTGFLLRSMNDTSDLPKRSLCSWRAFHPEEADAGADPTGRWYRNIQRAPSYRHDLDVIAVSASGDIESFATCYFDVVTRGGVIVLAGTAPLHHQKGLGRAVVTEAVARLKALGGIIASVSWYDGVAGALYQSAGFTKQSLAHGWKKQLD